MKYVKNIIIPIGFLCFYLCIGMLLQLCLSDTVLVTIVADLIAGCFGFFYYKKHIKIKPIHTVTSWFVGFFLMVIVLWFVLQITITYVYYKFGDTLFDKQSSMVQLNPYLYFALTLFVAPFAEEVLIRGILFSSLKCMLPIGFAYFISSVVFAGLHGTLIHMFIGITFGLFLAMIYEMTHQIWCCVVLHSWYNLLSFFGGGILLPDWCFTFWVVIVLNLVVFAFLIAGCIKIHFVNKNRNMSLLDASDDMS